MAETPAGPADAPPPCLPRPSDPSDLGSVRRPMVRWFDPHQLVDTAVRVLLSGTFSSYADNRELQAREPAEVPDRSGQADLWLDYVADLGDGWNSTYTVARLLATEGLTLDWAGETHCTERGRILVMGGDQVYPVPKAVEYENRMLGPYRAALPCVPGEAPELFAIPGTHDWYDGLVNFTSIFCRNRWIGGWRTCQPRSYFALKLPNGWWLWGIDIQFGACIDEANCSTSPMSPSTRCSPGIASSCACPRRSRAAGSRTRSIPTGMWSTSSARSSSRAVPSCCCTSKAESTTTPATRKRTAPATASSRAAAAPSCTPPTTSPSTSTSPEQKEPPPTAAPAPIPPAVSKRLRKRIWLIPAFNLPLAAVFGTVQVLLAFMMGLHLQDRYVSLGLGDLLRAMWESPTAFLLSLLVLASLAGMVRFAHDASGIGRVLLGLAHSTLQVASVAGVMLAASHLSSALGLEGAWSLLAFLGLVGLLGAIAGMVGMAGYLWATNCLGLHGTEGYAPLHHQDLKHFLRLHVEADGALTVYPIAVDRVGRKWTLCPDAPAHAPWFAPDGSEPEPHLIEQPIRIGQPDAHASGTTTSPSRGATASGRGRRRRAGSSSPA